jgi:hypothetical protein
MGWAMLARCLGRQVVAVAATAMLACFLARSAEAQFFEIEPPLLEADDGPVDVQRLNTQGLDGLARVLDELLPDTAEPKKLTVAEGAVRDLIGQLGADSYRARESATRQLSEIGEGARPMLVKAAHHSNAEISWRATRILRSWETRKFAEKPHYLGAFSQLCSGLRDAERLKELARRTKLALENGLWGDTRTETIRVALTTLLRSDDSQYVELARPYLKHADVQMALLVAEAACQAEGNRGGASGASPLFLETLQSPREELATVAINYVSHGFQAKKNQPLKEALLGIFAGNNENLRFQAAYPLMRVYQHGPAYEHVLEQAAQADVGRRHTALSWLQAENHLASAPDEKLLKAIAPLLTDDDMSTRMMAAYTLSSYKGEDVVRRLLPLLADKEGHISSQVGARLLEQPDKKMVRRVLDESAKDKKLGKRVRELLQQLDQLESAAASSPS